MLSFFGLGRIGTYLMAGLAILGALFGIYKAGGASEKKKQKIRNLETYVDTNKRATAAREASDAKTAADPDSVVDRLREHGSLRD